MDNIEHKSVAALQCASLHMLSEKKNVNMATTRFTASFFQPVKTSKIQNKKKVNVDGTESFTFRLKENQVMS